MVPSCSTVTSASLNGFGVLLWPGFGLDNQTFTSVCSLDCHPGCGDSVHSPAVVPSAAGCSWRACVLTVCMHAHHCVCTALRPHLCTAICTADCSAACIALCTACHPMQYMHIPDRDRCNWLRERIETPELVSGPAQYCIHWCFNGPCLSLTAACGSTFRLYGSESTSQQWPFPHLRVSAGKDAASMAAVVFE